MIPKRRESRRGTEKKIASNGRWKDGGWELLLYRLDSAGYEDWIRRAADGMIGLRDAMNTGAEAQFLQIECSL